MKNNLKLLQKTGFFHIFSGNVFSKIINFVSSIILVRLVSKSSFGIFSYSWNIYSIVILASGFGSASAILQLCSEKPNDSNYRSLVYSYGLHFGLKVNFLLGLLLLSIAMIFPLKIPGSATLLFIMVFLPLFQFINEFQQAYLRVERMNREFSIYNFLTVLSILFFSIASAKFIQEKGFIVSRYLSYCLIAIISIIFWKIPLPLKIIKLDNEKKNPFIHVAIVSMLNSGLSNLLYLLDIFIIGIILSDSLIIASYKVATVIPTAITFIPISIIIYAYPYFAEHKGDGEWCLHHYKIILLVMVLVNLLISGFLYICAPSIISILYGRTYLDSLVPFRVLAISYFFSGTFRTIAGNLLVTQRKLFFNTFVALFSGIVNIVADAILIRKMGSTGAAFATLIVVVITSIMNVSYSRKNVSYSFLGFMQHDEVLRYLNKKCFHIFINASSSEGLPVSMMEALSNSTPIIGTDVGGVTEIVDYSNGMLLPCSASALEFAKEIERIANMPKLQ